MDDFSSGRDRTGSDQLAVEVQAHFACIRIKGGCHMVPFVLFQIVAIGPDAKPFVSGANLERQAAMALVAQNEALVIFLIALTDDAGKLIISVFCRIGIVPLEGAGSDPGADRQSRAFHGNMVLIIGNVGGAVKEQAATPDALGAPLGVLAVRIGGVGKMVVQLCIRQISGSIGNGKSAALVQLQMQEQIILVRVGIFKQEKYGDGCGQDQHRSHDQD